MPGGRFYTEGSNGGGAITATYISGEVIDVEVTITAHHRGMLYLRLCDEARVTEECLEKYEPLQRVRYEDSELIQAQPINEKYPFLYYLRPICYFDQSGIGDGNMGPMRAQDLARDIYDGSPKMQAKFKLPDGVTCEHCVIQMHWITANSCTPPTYKGFDFPPKYDDCPGDGVGWYSNYPDCIGTTFAEEFWNCKRYSPD